MKRKGERHIPDFSRKPKPAHGVPPERQVSPAPVPQRSGQSKPQATSSKSGRRGQ
jgi:hypothetical protein